MVRSIKLIALLILVFACSCVSELRIAPDGNSATYQPGFGRKSEMSLSKPDGTRATAKSSSDIETPDISIIKLVTPGL